MVQHFQFDESMRSERRSRPETARLDEGSSGTSPSRLILLGGAGIFVLAGVFLLATIHSIATLDAGGILAERDRAAVAVEVMTRGGVALDSSRAITLGHDFVLNGTRLAQPGSLAADEVSVPVPATSMVLAWKPRRLASETFATVAPYRFAAAGLVLAGLVLVLAKLYKLARSLETRRRAARDLATRDPLTCLLNRRGLDEALERGFESGGELALLYLDLDDFKPINDRYGHATGDQLLSCVGQRLQHVAGPEDSVARLGGDEFVILRRSATSPVELEAFASLIHSRVTLPYGLGDVEAQVGLSIGIATRTPHMFAPEDLVASADAALYRAKDIEGIHFALAEELAEGLPKAA